MVLVEKEFILCCDYRIFTLLFITFWYLWKVKRIGLSLLNTPFFSSIISSIYFPRRDEKVREGGRERNKFSSFAQHSISGHRCCFRPMHWSSVMSSNVSHTTSRQPFAICDWIGAVDCSSLLYYIINPDMALSNHALFLPNAPHFSLNHSQRLCEVRKAVVRRQNT